MPASDSPKTVFWPRTIRRAGFLYGWKFEDGAICVAGVVNELSHDKATEMLKLEHKRNANICPYGEDLKIIGECKVSDRNTSNKAEPVNDLLITLQEGTPESKDPHHRFILYEPPDSRKLRFFSQMPLELGTTSYSLSQSETQSKTSDISRPAEYDGVFPPPKASSVDLERVVSRLNTVKELQRQLSKGSVKEAKEDPVVPLVGYRVLDSGLSLLQRILAICLAFLNCPLVGQNSLKDFSATAHQLDVRLRQAYTVPATYQAIYHGPPLSAAGIRAQYINFYNMLWLIANDVIIGSAVTAFCVENNETISRYLTQVLRVWPVKGLQDTLLWLNDWPGGLKLNYELGSFFCDAFLWFTAVWEGIVLDQLLLPNLPTIITLIGFSASAGTTLFLALCSDLLSISTLHVYLFYSMATTIFSFHTSAMASLFNIFRGKKRNILRNRVEPSTYTLDQLLIGAVLFTLAAFLLPTVLAFYLVFAASRCAIIVFHAGLEAILAFLNHFPLFAMMLRVKDPQRLPGGLSFALVEETKGPYLVMRNNPIPASAIFHQYWALWSSFSQHYSPIYLLGKVVTGRYINPIPRSRLTFVSREESA